MDLFAVSIILLSIMFSGALGWYIISFFTRKDPVEIRVIRAFRSGHYKDVVSLVLKSRRKRMPHSVSLALARSYARLDEHAKALDVYARLLTRLPSHSPLFAEVCREQGDILLKNKEFSHAQSAYMLGLKGSPDDPFLRYRTACSLFDSRRYKEAREILRDLLKENPNLPDVRLLYADTLSALSFYQKAIQHYGILDRAGEKIVTYGYAKALKELKMTDRGIQAYLALLKSDVDTHLREEMILDCANLYLQSFHFDEGLAFIQNMLPALTGSSHMELRYIRASLTVKKGDEYEGLQEFALLYEENPEYKDLKAIMELGGEVLKMPYLKRYFTSDHLAFEQFLLDALPAGMAITRRSSGLYIFAANGKAFAFYRHYRPAPESYMEDIDKHYQEYCQNAPILEFWAFSGFAIPTVKFSRSDYTIKLRQGFDFSLLMTDKLKEKQFLQQLRGGF